MDEKITFDMKKDTRMEPIELPLDIKKGQSIIVKSSIKVIDSERSKVLNSIDKIRNSKGNSSKENGVYSLKELIGILALFGVSMTGNYRKSDVVDKILDVCSKIQNVVDNDKEDSHIVKVSKTKSSKTKSRLDFM